MPVETPSIFAQVIKEHLDLKERNSRLGGAMPIEHYKGDGDPFENHPLFKSEEQARIEHHEPRLDGIDVLCHQHLQLRGVFDLQFPNGHFHRSLAPSFMAGTHRLSRLRAAIEQGEYQSRL